MRKQEKNRIKNMDTTTTTTSKDFFHFFAFILLRFFYIESREQRAVSLKTVLYVIFW